MKKKFILLPLIVFFLIAIFKISTHIESLKSDGIYYGEIQAVSYDVSTAVPGILSDILINEGDKLNEGQLIASIDNDDITIKYEKAKQSVLAASAKLEKVSSPAREEEITMQALTIEQLNNQKKSIEANLSKFQHLLRQAENTEHNLNEIAKLNLQIMNQEKELLLANSTSQNKYESAELEFLTAQTNALNASEQTRAIKSDINSLQNQLAAMDSQIAIAKEKEALLSKGLDFNDQRISKAELDAAELDLKAISILLEKYQIKAPISGIVESVNFNKGEFVSTGSPIVTVVDTNKQTVNIYIKESDLNRINLGDVINFSLVSDENQKIDGIVTNIASEAMFTPMNIVIAKDRERLVFKITISLKENKAFKPGMLLIMKLEE